MNRQKLYAAALVLPIVGAFLLLSPMIRLFAPDQSGPDMAGAVVYVFAVWLGLIVLSALIAGRLVKAEPLDEPAIDESESAP
jgi:hypothetical protein